jgi:ankyrin repeat protein
MPGREIDIKQLKLIQHAGQGELTMVRRLLNDEEVDVNWTTEGGWTALISASFEGFDKIVELLLDYGADTETIICHGNQTALMKACENNHVSTVKLLLCRGANVYDIRNIGWCPLHWACTRGYDSIVKMFMERGVHPNGLFKVSRRVPLHSACWNGHMKCVDELLLYGAHIDIRDGQGKTAYDLAREKRHKEIVSLLKKFKKSSFSGIRILTSTRIKKCTVSTISTKELKYFQFIQAASDGDIEDVKTLLNDRDVDVDGAEDFNRGRSALISACYEGHDDIVELLLGCGANTEAKTFDLNNTALMMACQRGHTSTVKLLLGHGANIDAYNKDDCSPLYESCRLGHIAVTSLLLEHGANPNRICKEGHYLPLIIACSNGYSKAVGKLLHYGADVDVKDNNGRTPIDLAQSRGHHSTVTLLKTHKKNMRKSARNTIDNQSSIQIQLIEAAREGRLEYVKNVINNNDVNMNWVPGNRWTALVSACLEGHDMIAQILLDYGANAEEKQIALIKACGNGHLSTVKLLLDHGANIYDAPKIGWCPLHWACLRGHYEIVKTLIERGANPNGISKDSLWSPLHMVCHKGDLKCAKELLSNGADFDGKCSGDKTPLHVACYMGQWKCVEELLHCGADTDAKDSGGRTPIELARKKGHESAVYILTKYKKRLDVL